MTVVDKPKKVADATGIQYDGRKSACAIRSATLNGAAARVHLAQTTFCAHTLGKQSSQMPFRAIKCPLRAREARELRAPRGEKGLSGPILSRQSTLHEVLSRLSLAHRCSDDFKGVARTHTYKLAKFIFKLIAADYVSYWAIGANRG